MSRVDTGPGATEPRVPARRPAVIGFDADDTLWHSEAHFVVTEERFRALVAPWVDGEAASTRLLARERANLARFGYGIKGFTLSMIETAIEVSDAEVSAAAIDQIIGWGKEMLGHPIELLPGVVEVMEALSGRHRLLLITKGDLFHQESKVAESGLAERFAGIEIVSEKDSETYARLLERHGVDASDFVMIGNSMASDVEPVVALGGRAIHVPYRFTWAHEQGEAPHGPQWRRVGSLGEVPGLLAGW